MIDWLADSNVWLRSSEPDHSMYPAATQEVYRKWRAIVLAFGVTGIKVHDTRLVAAMLAHGLTHILTFNVKDFERYIPLGITVVHPEDVK